MYNSVKILSIFLFLHILLSVIYSDSMSYNSYDERIDSEMASIASSYDGNQTSIRYGDQDYIKNIGSDYQISFSIWNMIKMLFTSPFLYMPVENTMQSVIKWLIGAIEIFMIFNLSIISYRLIRKGDLN